MKKEHNALSSKGKDLVATTAENLKKSVVTPAPKSLLPSEPAAAHPSSIVTDQLLSDREVAKCTLLLLKAMSREMIGSDVWIMAISTAEREAEAMGIKDAKQIMARVLLAVRKNREQDKFMMGFMG